MLSTPCAVLAQASFSAEGGTVVINCPDEIELQVLVDYVGTTLGLRFVYGEELKNQKVELRPSPVEVPQAHLLELLTNLLRVRDLAAVELSPGFFRIVRGEDAARSVATVASPGGEPPGESPRLITQVLDLPAGKAQHVSEKLSAFLSSPKAGLIPLPEMGAVIVTDYEPRVRLLEDLLKVLESRQADVQFKLQTARGADAGLLASQASSILGERQRLSGAASAPVIRGDLVAGSVVIIGSEPEIREVEALVADLLPQEGATPQMRSYAPKYISIARLKQLIEGVLLAAGSAVHAPTSMFEDAAGGRLFITADAATHEAVSRLLQEEDKPLPEPQRPLRVYRPENRKAGELLLTLTQLLGTGAQVSMMSPPEGEAASQQKMHAPGPNRPPSEPGILQSPPLPPAQIQATGQAAPAQRGLRVEGPDYVLTEDEATNSIIAIGTREFHGQLETLIEDLDRRRPQVLIEMTLVAITMNDSLDLGVELESLELGGDGLDHLLFSSFGLSTVDTTTGQRVLTPGLGANAVVLRPDRASIILRALAARGMAKVVSSPRILVSDNARGTLRNVDEAPFTSVNASDTVATTSFAGFESAGTTLSVTPHILEGEYLTLEYELTFSNFSGSSTTATVPPPRTTNSFTSTVEVPDGYSVVTGGLVVDNKSQSSSEVPFMGRIPLLGALFSSQSRQKSQTKIFAFIRPTILRDDRFEELKFISLKDAQDAELTNGEAVPDNPQWMQ